MSMQAEAEFIKTLLPRHYVVEPRDNGVHCQSQIGISEKNNDEAFETMVMDKLRSKFGTRLMEVFHQTCTNHLSFTVYLHPQLN